MGVYNSIGDLGGSNDLMSLPELTFQSWIKVAVFKVFKKNNFQISQEPSFNSSHSSFPSSCLCQTKRRLVCYRLSAGRFVCVGPNERGKRHFPLLTSCLLDGSLLGSSGQTARSLIEGQIPASRRFMRTSGCWSFFSLGGGVEKLWLMVWRSVNI